MIGHHIIDQPAGIIMSISMLTPTHFLQLNTSILLTLSARVHVWTGVTEVTWALTGTQTRLKVGLRPAPVGFNPCGLSLHVT